MKVYTKTGDSGTSSLFNGERLPKDNIVFDALGHVDELNSVVGVAREFCEENNMHLNVAEQLEEIQSRLLDVGSVVATPISSSSEQKLNRVKFDEASIIQLEMWIDALDAHLPQLRNFILPSGGKASSFLHLARSVCRRAERSVVTLSSQQIIGPMVVIYLNRLSDYFFQAARFVALQEGKVEKIHKKSN